MAVDPSSANKFDSIYDRFISCLLNVPTTDRSVGPVVKASASRVADLGSIPAFDVHLLQARVIPITSKLAPQWLAWQAPGLTGSSLGLVGPMSVDRDRVT